VVDVVFSGYDYDYECFVPQVLDGMLDIVCGICEFVVGMGGGFC